MSSYSPPARITLITHPATAQQTAGVFPADESLDPQTLEQLSTIAWHASRTAQAVTAPELRTRQTTTALGLTPIEAHDLRECDFGLWRGVALETLQTEDPDGLATWLMNPSARPHQGESFMSQMERVGNWIDMQRSTGHVIAITHASVVRAAIAHVLQVPPHHALRTIEIAPLTLTDIRLTGNTWRLRSMGVPLSQAGESS
jgi:broad specificity phosphatase PhoE